jgi:ribosome biogenesis SPOUT family RNA methylase Rps3
MSLPETAAKQKMDLPRLYVENFEQCSEWLLLEYRHCLDTWENISFTNVQDTVLRSALSVLTKRRAGEEGTGDGRAEVRRSRLAELEDFRPPRTIVLDPEAPRPLCSGDFPRFRALVIGGILGNEGFTGKTGKLLTASMGCQTRNLGKIQLSIDSAAVVCKLIVLGMKLEDIELSRELEIFRPDGSSTVLPYGYPVIDGKVIFTPGLREYLEKH